VPTLRPARSDEAELLSALAERSEAHCGYGGAFMARYRELYRITPEWLAGSTTFVAEEGGVPVGFYALAPGPDGLELEYLYVEPGRIGTGLGRILWQHLTGQCRRLGVRELHLVCADPPKAFYLRMGALVVAEAASRVLPERRVWRMVMHLGDAP